MTSKRSGSVAMVQLTVMESVTEKTVSDAGAVSTGASGTLPVASTVSPRALTLRDTGDPAATGAAEGVLTGALRQVFALGEAYPDLKANTNFLDLQGQLADTEDKISAARRIYNGNVRDYNTKIQQLPSNIIAGIGNFTVREFFEIEEPAERAAPSVSFS